jgi:hypothetical protein
MPQRSPSHERPPAAIAYNIGLSHASAPTSMDEVFGRSNVRVFAVLAMLLLGALATGALTVVATALPGQPGVQRAAAVLGSALVVFAVLLVGAKV